MIRIAFLIILAALAGLGRSLAAPAENAPVTAEKDPAVSRVAANAPGEIPAPAAAVNPERESKPLPAPGFLRRTMHRMGRLHPVSVHFPIALLLTAVLAEGIAWWLRRDQWMLLVRFLVVLGALSSVPAALFGWFADFPAAADRLYRFHLVFGTMAAAWSLVCATLVCMAECEEGSVARRRFRGALLLGAFLIAVACFLGHALGMR